MENKKTIYIFCEFSGRIGYLKDEEGKLQKVYNVIDLMDKNLTQEEQDAFEDSGFDLCEREMELENEVLQELGVTHVVYSEAQTGEGEVVLTLEQYISGDHG